MGSLLIQVGQCGNQIGLKVWDTLMTSQQSASNFLFSQPQMKANAILIDTEPKVLRPIKEDKRNYAHIETRNILFYQYGRGNNWAMGYYQNQMIKQDLPKISSKKQIGESNILEKISVMKNKSKSIQFKTSNFDKDFHDDQFILKENSMILENTRNLIQKEIEKIDFF